MFLVLLMFTLFLVNGPNLLLTRVYFTDQKV